MNPVDYPICLDRPRRITSTSAWVGHLPFAMALIDAARPARLVELGSFTGESFCAMCQAIDQLGLDCQATAIDTWKGDHHSCFYGPWVLEDLRGHHDPLYGRFSRLLQSTFDDAINQFEDGSIDLLHIDGLHTYEAARHDFDTWKSKLTDRAIVLFHDVAIRRGDFGVWKVWDDLKGQYPSFSFDHSAGLGVLCVGPNAPQPMRAMCELDSAEASKLRTAYEKLGDHWFAVPGRSLDEVERQIGNLFKLADNSPDRYLAAGFVMLAEGDPEAARRAFGKVLHSLPDHERLPKNWARG